jgi:hypothetical protein
MVLATVGTTLIIGVLAGKHEAKTSVLNNEDHAVLPQPEASVLNHGGHYTSKEFEASCGPAPRHRNDSAADESQGQSPSG